MTIHLRKSTAKDQALAIMAAGEGETDSLEVFDELLRLVPPNTVFKREGGAPSLDLSKAKIIRNELGLDPR